jgi:hypothetical protein
MNHERAIELIIDSLLHVLEQREREELEQHLASCPACTAELEEYQHLWMDLSAVVTPKLERGTHAADSKRHAVGRLAEAIERVREEEFGPAHRTSDSHNVVLLRKTSLTRFPAIFRTAAAIVLVLGGVLLGRGMDRGGFQQTVETPSQVSAESPQFLFLMFRGEAPTPAAEAELTDQVVSWVVALEQEDRLVTTGRLAESPNGWVGSDPNDEGGREPHQRSGFMLVRAADLEEARQIASNYPSLAYGGAIEVLTIKP